jgi:hypothetical protein
MSEINNSFDKTLRELRHGAALDDCSKALAEVVAAVRATGKPGKLKLELSIVPTSRGDARCVTVHDDVAVKLPKGEKAITIFYADDENLLQRNDPRQRELALRQVEPAVEALKTVTAI